MSIIFAGSCLNQNLWTVRIRQSSFLHGCQIRTMILLWSTGIAVFRTYVFLDLWTFLTLKDKRSQELGGTTEFLLS